ncbi:MAG: MATE family efflux transporter [Thermoplasmatota archaeon]
MLGKTTSSEILNGKIVPTMFKLGWPLMVGSLLQSAYNLADTYWLGNMGEGQGKIALAAVQASWPIIWLLMSIAMGFGIAAIALVSQHTGAGLLEEVNEDAGQLMLFFLIFSIIVSIIGFLTSPMFVRAILMDPGAIEQGEIYMQTIFAGIPFMFIFMAFMYLLQGTGDMITPLIITSISVIANIILDPLLIYGFGIFPTWGIFGAAFATVISRAGASTVALYLMLSGKVNIHITKKNMIPNLSRLKKFVNVGVPASIGNSGTALGFVVMMFVISRVDRPLASLAAYAAGDRILGLMFISMSGLAMATSTMIGQNLGADQQNRAENIVKKSILSLGVLMTIFTVVLFFFSRDLIAVFNQDVEVLEIGKDFLLIFSFSMPFFGVFRGVGAVHEGAGQTLYQMGLDISRLWLLRVPLSVIFAFTLGMQSTGIWIGMSLSNVIAAAIAVIVLATGKWREGVISSKTISTQDD